MAQKTPKIKHRAEVVMTDSQGRVYQQPYQQGNIQEFTETYGRDVFMRLPVGKKVGETVTYTIKVTYLGERQYKTPYAQRVKALASADKRNERLRKEHERQELERQQKELVQRRNRIMNQVELAFVKQGKDAVNFVTCDKCDAMATHLGLAYENPGSQVIDPDQITGAWCAEHDNKHMRPFKTTAAIACDRLEFFYDGLRQIYVKTQENAG